ncbi:MAG: hypothetical protein NVS9B7_24230 [Flavisolibacter sp.]
MYSILLGINNTNQYAKFNLSTGGKDRGFYIKSGDNGIGLVDLVNTMQIKPISDSYIKKNGNAKRSDAFTVLLSKSASDPSLLYEPVRQDAVVSLDKKIDETHAAGSKHQPKAIEEVRQTVGGDTANKERLKINAFAKTKRNVEKEEKKVEITEKAVSKIDSVQKGVFSSLKKPAKDSLAPVVGSVDRRKDTANLTEATPANGTISSVKSIIIKHSESSTTDGFGLIFFDYNQNKIDTIQLIIPNAKVVLEAMPARPVIETTGQKNKIKFPNAMPKDTLSEPVRGVVVTQDSGAGARKSLHVIKRLPPACKAFATFDDYNKLKKAMAARTSDKTMVMEAQKFFRSNCFTTEQIKNLSTLFNDASGKYLFFDAAYRHVADRDQFTSLKSELTDNYYIKRFQALVGE